MSGEMDFTFEFHLCSSLGRLLGHEHKSLLVGKACHHSYMPFPEHQQVSPLSII